MKIEVTSSSSFGRTYQPSIGKKEWFGFEEQVKIEEETSATPGTPAYTEEHRELSEYADSLVREAIKTRVVNYYRRKNGQDIPEVGRGKDQNITRANNPAAEVV